MKIFRLLVLFLIPAATCIPCRASEWSRAEILFPQPAVDGLCEDLNGDGLKDFLFLCGNSILVFFQTEVGFNNFPDDRIYYKKLGEYIDVGEVDVDRPGLEILGLSRDGIRCFYLSDSGYQSLSGFLISTSVRLPEYGAGPAISNFTADINGDGLDEIFLMVENNLVFYGKNEKGDYQSFPITNQTGLKTVSLRSRRWPSGIPFKETSSGNILIRPFLSDRKFVLLQDLNNDNKWDITGDGILFQGTNFRFTDSEKEKRAFLLTEGEKHRFFLDVDGNGKKETVDIISKDILSENINIFPFVKIFVHLEKENVSSAPDFFFKTIFLGGLSPFGDLDGDGDLDFISLWSDVTPGSKEDIIQIFVENTFEFTLRVYLYKKEGYTLSPDMTIQAKVKVRELAEAMETTPLGFFGDYDGNGNMDLLLRKEPESVLIYFLDWSRKKTISSVDRLQVPKETKTITAADLNGDGKSDLICWADDRLVLLFPSEEKSK
ncbi:MAG: VCBS repeat-containing protein [Candidatus Aminicenantes bacterium]|nr:VCBS repeat-containing protein [Candidatus Aminicenantes bacterium]